MIYRIIYGDELYHHGVKGMKWGVRKKREYANGSRASLIGYARAKNWQKKSGENRLRTANKHGQKALARYKSISSKYNTDKLWDKIFDESLSSKERESAYKELEKTEAKKNKAIDKQVYGYLRNRGYSYISRSSGSGGYMSLQFGRDLVNSQQSKYGEQYIDEYFINTQNKRAYRSED